MISTKLPWEKMNPILASQLNPWLNNPFNQIQMITNIALINGVTIVPHKLGRMMLGWFLIDIQGVANIYRSAPFNTSTLSLNSSAAVTVSLGVF